MKETHQENGVWHLHFDSVDEVRNAYVPTNNRAAYMDGIENERPSLSWYGVHGGKEEVIRLTDEGWPEGLARIREEMSELSFSLPRTITRKRRKVRSNHGDELDIHRVNSGNLDRAWSRTERVESNPAKKSGKRVVLSVDLAAFGKRHGEELFWRGACTIFVAERLIQAGYAVKIVAMCCADRLINRSQYTNTITTITLKTFDQRLNWSFIATATALAGFHRVFMFKALTLYSRTISSGFGRPSNLEKVDMFEKEASMHLHIARVWDKHQALEKAKDILNTCIQRGARR